jgi:hypothetical protein
MIVLTFGVRSILSGSAAAHAEMHTAHQLYNALVAIERWRRREYARLRSRYVPGLAEIDAAYEQLSEWIGEHAGPAGERGIIREKRRRATVKSGVPTKRVDATEEIDTIAELKAWRRAAGEQARPLREQFDAMLRPARIAYEARTRGVAIEWIEERERLRAEEKPDKAALSALVDRIEAASRKTHAKAAANARVLAEMLDEQEWSEAWKETGRLNDTAHRLRQWVGDAHHLNHGTYLAVQEAVQQAGKRPRPRPDGEPRKPRERPAFSRGRLRKMGWQLPGIVTWGDVISGRCRDVVVSEIRPSGRQWRARCRIRITTGVRGADDWVELDVVSRRRIPEDTRMRWVYLVPKERPHGRHEYEVQFTAEPTAPLIQRAPGDGHVRLELCWTQDGDTLIVARVNGEPLRLPANVPAQLRRADEIRGHADRHFDLVREEVAKRAAEWPEPLRQACTGLAQWRAHKKLHRVSELLRERIPNDRRLVLWDEWRRDRLSARLDLFAPLADYAQWAAGRMDAEETFALWLETWRRKDRHLVQMADGMRRTALLQRREFYRVTAARLCERFATYELGGAVDLATLSLRDKVEDTPRELHQAARRNRTIAAVSELKEALAQAFGPERERSGDARKAGGARSSGGDAADAPESPHGEAA